MGAGRALWGAEHLACALHFGREHHVPCVHRVLCCAQAVEGAPVLLLVHSVCPDCCPGRGRPVCCPPGQGRVEKRSPGQLFLLGFEDPSDDPGTVCPGHTKLNPDAGCFPVLKHDAKRVLHTVVIAALVLAGIEVFCLLASMCLLCCLNTKRVDPANQGLLNTPAPRSAYRATYSSRPYTEA